MTSAEIIAHCKAEWPAQKSDCSGFVRAVAAKLGVTMQQPADHMFDEIHGAGWTHLADGVAAKAKADEGWFVVAALKGASNVPPQEHGHVAVVVAGDLAHGKYPTGYWGRLGGVGAENETLNFAWNTASRDNVFYAARQV